MTARGFTVVELIITVVVITIILMLSIASLRSSQVASRNDERDAKARQIAASLDNYYQYGHSPSNTPPGRYPDTTTFTSIISSGVVEERLTGIDQSALRFSWHPDGETNIEPYYNAANLNDNQNLANITEQATSSGKILYEPLTLRPSGAAVDNDRWQGCVSSSQTCNRFNLYFIEEGSGQLITIEGSHG